MNRRKKDSHFRLFLTSRPFGSPAVSCSPVLLFKSLGSRMAFMFENLQVYQKAVDLADRIAALTARGLVDFLRKPKPGYYVLKTKAAGK